MHKKLKKYIETYLNIDSSLLKNNVYELESNGGMMLLLNFGAEFEIINNEKTELIKPMQTVLLNSYEDSLFLTFPKDADVTVVRFRGAGASFFFQELLNEVEQGIFVLNQETLIIANKQEITDVNTFLDDYLIKQFKPSTQPFNIMKIINLIEEKDGEYDIDEVLASANTPRRIFDKIFRRHVGLSLKPYAMIITNQS